MLEATQTSDSNVVDFMKWKLVKQIEKSASEAEFEVSSALLELYLTDQINVTMQNGELMFEGKELFETEEPVHIPVDVWGWIDEQD